MSDPDRLCDRDAWHCYLIAMHKPYELKYFCCVQGKRYSLPNSRIMIHQPLGGAQGQAAGKSQSKSSSELIVYLILSLSDLDSVAQPVYHRESFKRLDWYNGVLSKSSTVAHLELRIWTVNTK